MSGLCDFNSTVYDQKSGCSSCLSVSKPDGNHRQTEGGHGTLQQVRASGHLLCALEKKETLGDAEVDVEAGRQHMVAHCDTICNCHSASSSKTKLRLRITFSIHDLMTIASLPLYSFVRSTSIHIGQLQEALNERKSAVNSLTAK